MLNISLSKRVCTGVCVQECVYMYVYTQKLYVSDATAEVTLVYNLNSAVLALKKYN